MAHFGLADSVSTATGRCAVLSGQKKVRRQVVASVLFFFFLIFPPSLNAFALGTAVGGAERNR